MVAGAGSGSGISSLSCSSAVNCAAAGIVDAELASEDLGFVVSESAVPAVTRVAPSSGSAKGGTQVTITGSGFTGATAVTFGKTAAASFTVVSATQITAVSPAHAAATVNITVTTPAGVSGIRAADKFTYLPPPVITAISPASGPPGGGTQVTITGSGFTGATAVTFGKTAASFAVVSATQITAVSPAHAAATVNITVTTPAGVSGIRAADKFTYLSTAAKT